MEDLVIRQAKIEDAPGIANVHVNSWRETYQSLLPESFIDKLPLQFTRRYTMWSRVIAEAQDIVFVAEHPKHGIVGFANGGHSREDGFEKYGELYAIYLLKPFQGKGIGYDLQNKVFGQLRHKGMERVYCWVLENNPTQRFYERTGATPKDSKKDEIGGMEVLEFRMVWNAI